MIERKMLIFLILFGVILTFPPTCAEALDGPIMERAFSSEIRTLFDKEDFSSLEKIAYDLRKGKSRFPSGTWKLRYFYSGLEAPHVSNLAEWEELGKKTFRWTQAFPKSVTAQVAMGNFWLSFAWEARGTGYAKEVTEEGWKLWRERIEKAYHVLKAGPVDSKNDCPGRIEALLKVGQAMGWKRKTYDTIFQSGIVLEPSYDGFYLTKANYLMPRWFGEAGEWQKFAEKSVQFTPPSEGETMYTRIAWAMHKYYGTDFFGAEVGIEWQRMKQGFLDISKNFPDSAWNLNNFCKFACLAGDREVARPLFEKIGENPYIEAWESYYNFEKWRGWANSWTGSRIESQSKGLSSASREGQGLPQIKIKLGENLLINPDGQQGIMGWRPIGIAAIESVEGDPCFSIRSGGHFYQDIAIPETSNGYVVLVGRLATERINPDGAITGLPYLYGYLMSGSGILQEYLQGQKMLFDASEVNKWVSGWGVFPIKGPVNKIRFFLKQAERKGVPQNGSAARFDDLGLYFFNTEAEALNFLTHYEAKSRARGGQARN